MSHKDPAIASVRPGDRLVVSVRAGEDYHGTVAKLRDRGIEVDVRQIEAAVTGDSQPPDPSITAVTAADLQRGTDPISTFYAFMNTTVPGTLPCYHPLLLTLTRLSAVLC